MFNPYSEKIYDYLGGIEDIKKAKVCCIDNCCICIIFACVQHQSFHLFVMTSFFPFNRFVLSFLPPLHSMRIVVSIISNLSFLDFLFILFLRFCEFGINMQSVINSSYSTCNQNCCSIRIQLSQRNSLLCEKSCLFCGKTWQGLILYAQCAYILWMFVFSYALNKQERSSGACLLLISFL
jgi:hypothetical protein